MKNLLEKLHELDNQRDCDFASKLVKKCISIKAIDDVHMSKAIHFIVDEVVARPFLDCTKWWVNVSVVSGKLM